jgi:transcriptional regulator with XRE-family HTH domain
MTSLSRAVGARLRELRLDAELTQVEVARRMGSHRPIVCRSERGISTLELGTLAAHALALELDLLDVLALVDVDGLVTPGRRVTPGRKRARKT